MYKFLGIILTIVLTNNGLTQNFPSIDKKIVFAKNDFKAIEKLMADGLPNQAIRELLLIQKQAVAENNLYNYNKCMEQLMFALQSARMEPTEMQDLLFNQHELFHTYKSPLKNLAAVHMSEWFNQIRYQTIFSFDDESLLWNLNGERVKLENGNAEPILLSYQTEYLKNDREMMCIASDQIYVYDSSSVKYNPTLYDVVANYYLENAANEDQDISCHWETTPDFSQKELSGKMRVYANLEQLHQANERWETYAFYLERRINTCNETAENMLPVYAKFQDELKGYAVSNRFALKRAAIYASFAEQIVWKTESKYENGFLEALKIIDQALETYPASEFTSELTELKNNINQSSLSFSLKRIDGNILDERLMNVTYRNTTKAILVVYKIEGKEKEDGYNRNELLNYKREKLSQRILDFEQDPKLLRHDKDFILSDFKKIGHYLLVIAPSELEIEQLFERNIKNYPTCDYQSLYISNVIVQTNPQSNGTYISVNRADNGKPISGAKIKIEPSYGKDKTIVFGKTDKKGLYFVKNIPNFNFVVECNDEKINGNGRFYPINFDRKEEIVYTDRSIYRPGQIINFKTLSFESGKDSAALITSKPLKFQVKDQNRKEIYTTTLTRNEFGSTAGSFVLPKTGFPLGLLYIYIDEQQRHSISVEEYKRPTFEVKIDEPKGSVVFGSPIAMEGQVLAYAGYPLANLDVSINISEARFFPRWCIVLEENRSYDTTIQVKTDKDGRFKFDYLPEKPKDAYGVYYHFEAIASDLTGETQFSNRYVYVGKTSYTLSAEMSDKYEMSAENEAKINVFNSQNVFQKNIDVAYQIKRNNEKNFYTSTVSEAEFKDFNPEQFEKAFPFVRYFPDQQVKYDAIRDGKVKSGEKIKLTDLAAGNYELALSTIDEMGDTITSSRQFIVWSEQSKKPACLGRKQHHEQFWLETSNQKPEMDEKVTLTFGSSYKKVRLFVAIYNENGLVSNKYYKLKKRKIIRLLMDETFKKGASIYARFILDGQSFRKQVQLIPQDTTKQIQIKLKSIQEPLRPGSTQNWELEVVQNQVPIKSAELLASMYDASLDVFRSHQWRQTLLSYTPIYQYASWNYTYTYRQPIVARNWAFPSFHYAHWNDQNPFSPYRHRGYGIERSFVTRESLMMADGSAMSKSMPAPAMMVNESMDQDAVSVPEVLDVKTALKIRENFNETAFFEPQIHSTPEGNYKWSFTLPDALTRWKLMTLAHTKDFQIDYHEQLFEARKELMLETFEPRFWRKGDSLVWVGKVTNLAEKEQRVDVKLKFTNPMTEENISSQFGEFNAQQIILAPNESKAVEWAFFVPDNAPLLVNFEAEASTTDFSDIVRKPTPILSGTETITMAENFTFDEKGTYDLKLRDLAKISNEAKLISFGIQVQPQPMWSTLLSLAQLMEPKNELTEGYFTQYFSTQLAQKILNENPDMKRALQTWKLADEDALTSALNQNEELKALLLSETVWVINAENETQQLRRLGQLLDEANLKAVSNASWEKLKDLQLNDGTWSWIGQERTSWSITQYVANGLAWLKESRITVDEQTFSATVVALNTHYNEQFAKLKKEDKEKGLGLHTAIVQWLYIRSFTDAKEDSATLYFASLIPKSWKEYSLSTQAIMGLWAIKKGDLVFANKLKASFMDKARRNRELGTYWLENQCGYGWYENNIETQSTLIEFLAKAGQSPKDVQAMQMWLIQQKRTQQWDSPKSTAMACYALQKFGNYNKGTKAQKVTLKIQNEADLLVPNEKVSFSYQPERQNWSQVKSSTALKITEDAPVFASMQVTYSDKSANIQKTTGDFRVERIYYLLVKGEEVAIAENQALETGDILRIKIKLVSNRNLDFVYIEDPKAPGWEPMNALSGYHYSSGMYYLSNRDSKTEFFIENLNKGTHNYVYDIKLTAKGNFHVGPTKAMCYYTPTYVANTNGKVFRVD